MAVSRFRHVLYSPGDDVKSLLDGLPDQARTSLWIEIYGLTDTLFVNGLIRAAQRGVLVVVMNDRSQAAGPKDHLVLQMLVDAGAMLPEGRITVRVVESERGAIDHLKQTILDGASGAEADNCSVTYGSFNYSGDGSGVNATGAQAQDNIFVWENDPGVCAQAIAKFQHDLTANKSLDEWQILPTQKK